MTYSQFTIAKVKQQFQLETEESINLFENVEELEISDFLKTLLEEYVPLGLSIGTEKARSEFIIAPVLAELRKLCNREISLFSGVDFNINEKKG